VKKKINGRLIEEYYWAGKWVVYVDNRAVSDTFEQVLDLILHGQEPNWEGKRER
jgi:hypothetical protein